MQNTHCFFLFLFLCFSFGSMTTLAQDKSRPEYRQAVENARMTAQRNLAEMVLGVLIQSGTEIKDFVTQKDVILAKVHGQMRGVVFSRPIYDQSQQLIKVAARISREDAMNAIKGSGFDGTKLPSQTAFFDAIGESVYQDSSSDSSIEKHENPIAHSTTIEPLSFSLSYEQLAFILFETLNVPFPTSDFELLLSTLKNRGEVYFGLSEEDGIQLEFRLKQSDIQLILQAFIFDFETCERARSMAKNVFREGIVLACVLRGKEVFSLVKPIYNWYTAPLSLHYPMALFLTSTQQAPETALLDLLQKTADLQFTYFRGTRELQVRLQLDLAHFKSALKETPLSAPLTGLNAFQNSKAETLSFFGTLRGKSLLPNYSWIVLGTPMDCPKASGSDFARKGFFDARENARKLAEKMVLDYLDERFDLSLNALPLISPLFQGVSENNIVLQLNYSKTLLSGYLKQKYSDEELEFFFEDVGDGFMVWVTFSL